MKETDVSIWSDLILIESVSTSNLKNDTIYKKAETKTTHSHLSNRFVSWIKR